MKGGIRVSGGFGRMKGGTTALSATQPRDTTQLFSIIYIFKNDSIGNKKGACIYAYI